MNSISYLAHRADNVLRQRNENSEINEVNEIIDDLDDYEDRSDKEGYGSDEEVIEEPIKNSPLRNLLSIILFIPNLIIVKPIQYIWFIITFPLYLLEKKPYVESSTEKIKEPIEEPLESLEENKLEPVQSIESYENKNISNSTIFEEEEEQQVQPLLIDKNSIELKSPTNSNSLLYLSSMNETSKNKNINLNNTTRSYLAFPKTVFPTSLINSSLKKTLILDLDETLIHSISRGTRISVGSGHMIEVRFQNEVPTLYYVYKRPYCDLFLKQVSKWFNLVIFTASVQEYADPVVDWIESERKYFKKRFYRNNCTLRKGQGYIKDLATVDKNLNNLIIVDNSPISYAMHENNAIVVEGWINDPSDTDLLNLIPLLSSLRYTTDVRAVLALKNGEAAFER